MSPFDLGSALEVLQLKRRVKRRALRGSPLKKMLGTLVKEPAAVVYEGTADCRPKTMHRGKEPASILRLDATQDPWNPRRLKWAASPFTAQLHDIPPSPPSPVAQPLSEALMDPAGQCSPMLAVVYTTYESLALTLWEAQTTRGRRPATIAEPPHKAED
ncbi:hypothetical protein ColLi_12854 [Colletotrichum liriopes]|uniref:Uncharacterized protein n=1 Tax=Colletotrichum liriopes TaxID=708192 RepID=A0AA37GZ46_9PEZI|nr:hypothetical protein ColLi_12854 [Colletotrichum liriopes]